MKILITILIFIFQFQSAHAGTNEDRINNLIKTMNGVAPKYDGPNCWNSALVLAGALPSFRYTDEMEVRFWLKSPVCRELQSNEEPQLGDLLVIRKTENYIPNSDHDIEVHAFTYIDPLNGFTKNGQGNLAQYQIQSISETIKKYEVTDASCNRVYGRAPNCQNYVNYFRCQTMGEYISNNKPSLPSDFRDYKIQVDELEVKVSDATFNGIDDSNLQTLKDRVQNLQQIFMSYEKMPDSLKKSITGVNNKLVVIDPIRYFLWEVLDYSLSSMNSQLTKNTTVTK